ncbi:MAG: ABC transporter substrate-binding protein [Chloroflexota bacterium]|nr:ABC transporter substrate-binding protein [Chloroflexota bacterium]MDE3193197.1 ABC transporter substrate-binding protein [Chloroflexota bacterium]
MRTIAFASVFAILVAACGGAAAPSAAPSKSAAPSVAASAATATPAPKPTTVKFNWTAVSGASSGLWTAYEAGYFKDENLDVQLQHIASSSTAVAALLSKQIDFTHLDGEVDVDANLKGGNIRMVYAITNKLVFSVMAKKDITKPDQLKGKKLGITKIGSSTDTAARLALSTWGLKPDTDVSFIGLSEVPQIFTALTTGAVDAGVVSPPTSYRAKDAGFNELLNLATDGPDWPSVGIGATADYIKANPDIVTRVIRAYSKGVWRFKTDKAFALTVLKKYLSVSDEKILTATWTDFSKYLASPPYPKGFDNVIKRYTEEGKDISKLKTSDLVDTTAVKALDDAGFYTKLYGK